MRGPSREMASCAVESGMGLFARFRPLTRSEAAEITAPQDVYFVPARRPVEPGVGAANRGRDDENGRYLTQAGDHIAFRYEVISKLGRGAFGDCWLVHDHKTKTHVALKIIRNEKRFLIQGRVEVQILESLAEKGRDHNCVRMLDNFMFRNHLCLTFDLHSHDLYTELKAREFAGFEISDVRSVMRDVLKCLQLLKQKRIVHADLKPENILLAGETGSDVIVIDFGSSCFQHGRIHTYVQSRYYRAPEIVLGLGYGCEIDMWSLACVMVELMTGRPIFPAKNEFDLLLYQMEILGQVPDDLLRRAQRELDFFVLESADGKRQPKRLRDRKGRLRTPGAKTLEEVVPTRNRDCLDFLRRCLVFNPKERITPDEALAHPFFAAGGMSDRGKWSSNGSIDSGVACGETPPN